METKTKDDIINNYYCTLIDSFFKNDKNNYFNIVKKLYEIEKKDLKFYIELLKALFVDEKELQQKIDELINNDKIEEIENLKVLNSEISNKPLQIYIDKFLKSEGINSIDDFKDRDKIIINALKKCKDKNIRDELVFNLLKLKRKMDYDKNTKKSALEVDDMIQKGMRNI